MCSNRHLLVAAYAFDGQDVRIRILDSGGAELVVNVHQKLARGAHLDPFDRLCAPFLVPHVDEAELDAHDAPFHELVEDRLRVRLQRLAVHVEDHANPLLLCIREDF